MNRPLFLEERLFRARYASSCLASISGRAPNGSRGSRWRPKSAWATGSARDTTGRAIPGWSSATP